MRHIFFFKFLIMDLRTYQYILVNSWFSQPSNATKSLYRLCTMYAWHISRNFNRLSASTSKWHLPSTKNYILTLTISHHTFNVPFPHSDELFVCQPIVVKRKVGRLGSWKQQSTCTLPRFMNLTLITVRQTASLI